MKPASVKMQDMYEGKLMLAIFLRRKDGSEFMAFGSPSGPALFYANKEARKYLKELREHKLRGVVRRVEVTIRPQ